MVTDVGLFGGGVFAGSQPFEVTAPLHGALLGEAVASFCLIGDPALLAGAAD